MSHKARLLAIRARYQMESAGYSRLSLSKARHSTISFPHMFDQLAQVLPMVSGDTSLPLERCSTIDTYSMSILMVSSELSEGGLEQVTIFKVLEEHGELGPLYTMSAAIEVVAGGGEGV